MLTLRSSSSARTTARRFAQVASMPDHLRSLERAFQLAKTGAFRTVQSIKQQLHREGYHADQIEGPTLNRQLMDLIEKAPPYTPRDPE